jgi:hypothetical protein
MSSNSPMSRFMILRNPLTAVSVAAAIFAAGVHLAPLAGELPENRFAVSGTHSIEREETMQASPGEADPQVGTAMKDLSRRLDLPLQAIEVVGVEAVTWRDGSLGCPRPGMIYTQALEEGVRIRLRAGERIYAYHGGANRKPFYCEHPAE